MYKYICIHIYIYIYIYNTFTQAPPGSQESRFSAVGASANMNCLTLGRTLRLLGFCGRAEEARESLNSTYGRKLAASDVQAWISTDGASRHCA